MTKTKVTPSHIYQTCNYIYSVAASTKEEPKASQVLWEDPKEVEDRMKLIEKMKAMEKRLPTLEEDDQDTSGMETQSSLEMLEAE